MLLNIVNFGVLEIRGFINFYFCRVLKEVFIQTTEY